MVVDVKQESVAKRPKNQQIFEITAQACSQAGWRYKVDTGPEEPYLSNIRWLAGFRRMPAIEGFEQYAKAIVDLCADQPRTVSYLTEAVGHPSSVRPVLFYLLWRQIVATPLDERISGNSLISLPDRERVIIDAL